MLKEPKTEGEKILLELLPSRDNYYMTGGSLIPEKINSPLVISDLSGNVLDINQAGLNLLGYKYEQFMSIVFEPLIIPSLENSRLSDHAVEYGVLYLPDIQGQVHYFWVEIFRNNKVKFNLLTPAHYAGGEEYLAGLYLNQLRKSEVKHRKRLEAFHTALDLSLSEAALYNGTQLVFATNSFYKATGYTEEELLAMKNLEWIAPASRRHINVIFEQVIDQQLQNRKYQAMILTAEGQRIPYEFDISSLYYMDSIVALLIGSDISQIKEQEIIRRHNRRKTNVVNRIMRILAETQGIGNAINAILKCFKEEFPDFGFEIGLWEADHHINMYSCVNGITKNTLLAEGNQRLSMATSQQRTITHKIESTNLFDEECKYLELGYRIIIQIPINGLAQPFGIFRYLITDATLETSLIEEIVAEIVLALQTFVYREKIAQISREAA
ncbi:MAG: PAS domain-containing protein, partial [Syntrophomonadaceae bacterium]|nr:PAS domain-containing protein [Syntrophomonadaceae bacterium]